MPEAAHVDHQSAEEEEYDELTVPEWVEDTIGLMVDHPDDVRCDEKRTDHTSLLTVKVHPDDVGKAVGRQWGHFKAIESLLRAIGGCERRFYKLELENESTSPPPKKRSHPERGSNQRGRGPNRDRRGGRR